MSAEHEVSLASARSVLEAAGNLHVTPLVIGRDGSLLSAGQSRDLLGLPAVTQDVNGRVGETTELLPGQPPLQAANSNALVSSSSRSPAGNPGQQGALTLAGAAAEADVVFPLLHGPFGEDGRVQGFLDLLGLPYVGAGVLGSAVSMDKLAMKAVFAAHDLPQVVYAPVTRHAWRSDKQAVIDQLAQLGLPLFVKPANLGSSIGVSKASTESQLERAVEAALELDRRVIVEVGLDDVRELEIGVLGNDVPELSVVGEIRYGTSFYDYKTKYTDGQAELIIPADVPSDVIDKIKDMARRAFLAVDAAGLARVDFFYLPDSGELLLNEVNTIPGFTRHSMYPKLWQASGVPYDELFSRLVHLALEKR